MASDEEYLDGLMKSLMDADPDQNDIGTGGENPLMDPDSADFFGGIDSAVSQMDDDEEWVARLDDLLMSAEGMNQKPAESDAEPARSTDAATDAEAEKDVNPAQSVDAAVKEPAPVSGADSNDSAAEPKNAESDGAEDVNDLLDSIQMLDVDGKDSAKQKKKKKFKFPWGKKKGEDENSSEDQSADDAKPKEMSLKDIEKKGKKKDKKQKSGEENKAGGFKRFLELLFAEEEEEEPKAEEKKTGSENDELLKQLEKEDKGGAKKGKDKKKDKKEKKEKKPPKEKKPKEKKKKTEPKPEKTKAKEPPSKPVGKKNLFLACAFSLSILVAVLLLNIVLTDFAMKQDIANAQENGNYKELYQLLYGKELDEEETQAFGRASLVLQMERKLDIYEFYKEAGDSVRALDALLQGAKRYQELEGTDTYGAFEELQRMYLVILEHLNLDYGIGEEKAVEINSFEGRDYRRRIYSAAGGTARASSDLSDGEQAADAQQESAPENLDILPEEEDIIDPEPQTEGE